MVELRERGGKAKLSQVTLHAARSTQDGLEDSLSTPAASCPRMHVPLQYRSSDGMDGMTLDRQRMDWWGKTGAGV